MRGVANVVGKTKKKGAADGREAKTRLCRRRAWKKTKNVFHGTQNERQTTVEALHDFAGLYPLSSGEKRAGDGSGDGGPWRLMRRARVPYGGYPAAAD
jgi:hypothetical protein